MHANVTRRRIGFVLCSFGAASLHAQTANPGTTIHHEIDYKTTPARIYQALLDAKQFSALTNQPAEIDPRPGGAFKLFGGAIEGRNVELIQDKRIVQAWRPASWTAGEYSVVRFELVPRKGRTRIVFDHAGFTEERWETLSDGWREHYWEPLHKYLNA